MYKYAEKKLKNDLEQQRVLEKENEQELAEVLEKLDCITSYDDLGAEQVSDALISGICTLAGGGFFGLGIIALINPLLLGFESTVFVKIFFCLVALLSAAFLWAGKNYFYDVLSITKVMNALKQKGVEEYEKDQEKLYEKQKELESESYKIQSTMAKINEILKHIDFFRECAKDSFYQADTKEEYETLLNESLNYKQVLEEYLDKKIDYSHIHLNSFTIDYPKDYTKKLKKN